jgi:nucleotide-binding universal stress UspA family protein
MENSVIPPGTIVVGVDGSESAGRALEWAVDEAVRERRQVTLAHGVDPARAAWADSAGADPQAMQDALRADALATVGRAREWIADAAPDLAVNEVVLMADARVTLLQLSEAAALVVVGSRGRGPVKSLLLGSVGVALTRHASCPVVVVRPENRGAVRNGVVVGADATERSLATVEFAYRQASLHRLPLTIMHSYWEASSEDEARRTLAESIAGLVEKFPEVNARTELVRGTADDSLVRASERMDLVVVGTHHAGVMSAVVFGSIADAVVQHARCPVAVVPSEDG